VGVCDVFSRLKLVKILGYNMREPVLASFAGNTWRNMKARLDLRSQTEAGDSSTPLTSSRAAGTWVNKNWCGVDRGRVRNMEAGHSWARFQVAIRVVQASGWPP
jgi:hypothetical protein